MYIYVLRIYVLFTYVGCTVCINVPYSHGFFYLICEEFCAISCGSLNVSDCGEIFAYLFRDGESENKS